MTVSVAMATYNGVEYLRAQLDSLAAQTRLPDELVVTDDGSSDRTLAGVEEFARSAPFKVRIVRNDRNLGYAKNFEKAASLCTSDIVFFCDQDDVWHPEKIASVCACFDENPHVLTILNDARLVDEQGNWSGHTQYRTIKRVGLTDILFVTGCCSAHRREWLEIILPIPAGVAHDLWVSRAAHELGVASIIERPLQDFRRHGLNNSDWSLSRPEQSPAATLQFHWQSGLKPADQGWRFERELLLEMKKRIEDADPRLLLALLGGADRSTAMLDRRIAMFERRIVACGKKRHQRLVPVLRMLAAGDYRQFSGWKSAIKDLVRP